MEEQWIKDVDTGTMVFAWIRNGGVIIGLLQSQGEMIVGQDVQYFYHIKIGGGITVELYRKDLFHINKYISEFDEKDEDKTPKQNENYSGMTAIDQFYNASHTNREWLYGGIR